MHQSRPQTVLSDNAGAEVDDIPSRLAAGGNPLTTRRPSNSSTRIDNVFRHDATAHPSSVVAPSVQKSKQPKKNDDRERYAE
jgi:hypothetical protein